jgi:hypothetical protein
MRRRGWRGGRGRSAPRLLGLLRDAAPFGLRDLRPLERLAGVPDGLELASAAGGVGERIAVAAASSDVGDLIGWARVAAALDEEEGGPAELVIGAPAFLEWTRRAAARAAAAGTPVRLLALPGLAGSDDASVLESFTGRADGAYARPVRSILDRTVRLVEGAAAVAGVGAIRELPNGYGLYMRGELVLRVLAESDGATVALLTPRRRQLQLQESSFARLGIELHEIVIELARDPRLLDGRGAAREAVVPEVALAARVRVTAHYLPWSRDGERAVEWVGVDADGRAVLGFVRDALTVAEVPGLLAAADRIDAERDVWAPGSQGRVRLIATCHRVEGQARSLLTALGLEVQVRDAELRVQELPPARAQAPAEVERESESASTDEEPRGRRRGRRRRRGRPEDEAGQDREDMTDQPAALEGRREAPASRRSRRPAHEQLDTTAVAESGRSNRESGESELRHATAEPALEARGTEVPEVGDAEREPSEREAAERAGAAELEEAAEPRESEELEPSDAPEEVLEAELEEPAEEEPAIPEEPKRPRRMRAAVVVCDDFDSVLAGLVLARDRRNVVQFWVCPQESLMDYFKTGATDLSDNTDVLLVGFTAQPIPQEVLATAELYRGRLIWFDHHEWAVEDVERLREAIGLDSIVFASEATSSLAAVVGIAERRSRFTDKLVDLSGRRLSENDMQKWGYRVAGLVQRLVAASGDQRTSVQPVLSGKPAELPEPEGLYAAEAEWIEAHSPRITYFGEYPMVIVHVPEHLDAGEVARRLRTRTGARLSLASRDGDDIVSLGCDEEKRYLNVLGLVDQLGARLAWLQPRSGGDRVGRMQVEDLPRHPERLDMLIGEIVRNKSILYG